MQIIQDDLETYLKTYLHSQRLFFQIRSYSQVRWMYVFGDATIQPTTIIFLSVLEISFHLSYFSLLNLLNFEFI